MDVRNYKSIKNASVDLHPNIIVFIGKNNAGKSNIFDVIKFIGQGLENNVNKTMKDREGFKKIVFGGDTNKNISIKLSFEIPNNLRREIIKELFIESRDVKYAMSSKFFKKMFYYLEIKEKELIEKLEISNLIKGNLILYEIKGSWYNYEIVDLNLNSARQKWDEKSNFPAERSESGSGSSSDGRRILLGEGSRSTPPPPEERIKNHIQSLFEKKFIWISPQRKSDQQIPIVGNLKLEPDGSNLADVLHSYYTNKPHIFKDYVEEVKKVIPELQDILTPTLGNETTVGIHESGFSQDVTFNLQNLSSGIKNILILILQIITAPNNSLICIEEPEIHMHPYAQRKMLDFFINQSSSKKILISSHSPIFSSYLPIQNTRLVIKDSQGVSEIRNLKENDIHLIVSELGIKTGDIFESEIIVFIEGSSDKKIFKELTNRIKKNNKIKFIDSGGWNSMKYYANARVLASRMIQVPVFVILDGDTKIGAGNLKLRKRLINDLNIPKDNVITLKKNSIEDYLLSPKAIKKAFPIFVMDVKEIEQFLIECKGKRNKKFVLKRLFLENNMSYNTTEGRNIVREMPLGEIDDELKQIISNLLKAI